MLWGFRAPNGILLGGFLLVSSTKKNGDTGNLNLFRMAFYRVVQCARCACLGFIYSRYVELHSIHGLEAYVRVTVYISRSC